MSDDAVGDPNNEQDIRDLITEITSLKNQLNQLGIAGPEYESLENQIARKNIELQGLLNDNSILSNIENDYRIPTFFYLGSVLEAISIALGEPDENKVINTSARYINFAYERIYGPSGDDPFEYDIATLLSSEEQESLNNTDEGKAILESKKLIASAFDVPVPFNGLIDLLNDLEVNKEYSIMELISDILKMCDETIPGLNLQASFVRNESVLRIFHVNTERIDKNANVIYDKIDADADRLAELITTNLIPSFILNYGSPDSLIENMSVNSRIDPAFYSIFRQTTTGGTQIDLIELIKESADIQNQLREALISSAYTGAVAANTIAASIQLPVGRNNKSEAVSTVIRDEDNSENIINTLIEIDFNDVRNKNYLRGVTDWLLSVISNNGDFQQKIFSELIARNRNLAAKLLGSYLLEVEASIHGTVGMSNYDNVVIKNFIPGTGGMYLLTGVDDVITPSNFTTNLKLKLINSNVDL